MSAPVYQWVALPAQRVCGWCRLLLAPGSLPETTGICPACYVRLATIDAKRPQAGGAQ